jgi:hypothetical protein
VLVHGEVLGSVDETHDLHQDVVEHAHEGLVRVGQHARGDTQVQEVGDLLVEVLESRLGERY